MPPKTKKGKNVIGLSSPALVNALSLLHPDCVRDFEIKLRNRIMVEQHIYDPTMSATLHIPEIMELMKYQNIDWFFKAKNDYNKDLIRVFYVGLEERVDDTIRFRMGSQSYHVTEEL